MTTNIEGRDRPAPPLHIDTGSGQKTFCGMTKEQAIQKRPPPSVVSKQDAERIEPGRNWCPKCLEAAKKAGVKVRVLEGLKPTNDPQLMEFRQLAGLTAEQPLFEGDGYEKGAEVHPTSNEKPVGDEVPSPDPSTGGGKGKSKGTMPEADDKPVSTKEAHIRELKGRILGEANAIELDPESAKKLHAEMKPLIAEYEKAKSAWDQFTTKLYNVLQKHGVRQQAGHAGDADHLGRLAWGQPERENIDMDFDRMDYTVHEAMRQLEKMASGR